MAAIMLKIATIEVPIANSLPGHPNHSISDNPLPSDPIILGIQ